MDHSLMKTPRLLLTTFLTIGMPSTLLAFERVLTPHRIKDNGDVRLSDDVKLGRFQGGKYTSTPDAIETPQLRMMTLPPAVDLSLAGTPNPNALMSGAGNMVSFCPLLSCINNHPNGTIDGRYFDHHRASHLISTVTQDDGHSEEQALATIMTVNKGLQKKWAPTTAYALGDNISFSGTTSPAGNSTWRAIQAGITGSANVLPTTRPACSTAAPTPCPEFTATDGTVKWLWINDQRINGKLGHYNEVTAMPGGGSVWAGVDNLQLQPGYIPVFAVGREIDLTNNSGSDCIVGRSNCYGLSVFLQGSNKSTAFIDMSSANANTYASSYGILMGGAKANSEHDISIQSSAAVAIDIGSFGGVTHSFASVRDRSTSPTSVDIGGSHTAAITTNNASAIYALATGPNQKVCLNALDNCFVYDPPTNKTYFVVGGQSVMSIDAAGNVRAKGTFTTGTP